MKTVVEYLVLLPSDGTFCSTKTAFNQLLQLDSRLTLNGDHLTFHTPDPHMEFSCSYEIIGGEVQGKPQRFFQLTFVAQVSDTTPDEGLEQFAALLRAVRGVVAKAYENKAHSTPEVLWDDISAYYAQKAYPLLQTVENLMRRLIANFMLINVGKEWVTQTSPKDFAEALSKSKRKGFNNELHKVDFIDLADFLFKPYAKLQIEQLSETVRKRRLGEHFTAEDLQDYLPRSNWHRYFAGLVECDDQYLQSRWKDLYDLRCKVAHNTQFERGDYDRVCELTKQLGDILQAAVRKLPDVVVPLEEQEVVAEDAVTRLYPILGEFINSWRLLEGAIEQHAAGGETPKRYQPPIRLAEDLMRQGILNVTQYESLRRLMDIRNSIVHKTDVIYSEAQLQEYTSAVLSLVDFLRRIPSYPLPFSPSPDVPPDESTSDE